MSAPTTDTIMEPTETIAGLQVHHAARLLPDPTPEEYARLRADIKEHGLLVPIVMLDDKILDGRTRAQICDELGIDYTSGPMNRHIRVATFDEMDDPVATVLSLNAARRHLSATQIVEIYLEANRAKVEADKQVAKAAQLANLKQGAAREGNAVLSGSTAAKIAQAVGVSESTVKNVLRSKKAAASEGTSTEPSSKKKTPKVPVAKAGKKVTGKGYQGHLTKYGVGRHSIESLMMVQGYTTRDVVELWLQMLADAKRMGHAKFDEWLEPAVQWYSKVGIVLDMLQKGPAPTGEEIEAILDPDQQQDEAADDPSPDSTPQP
jgi:hypothetical protein